MREVSFLFARPMLLYLIIVGHLPAGWPQWAHEQVRYDNHSIHRRFGPLSQRVLHYVQLRLALREQRLHQLDRQDAENGSDALFKASPCQSEMNADLEAEGMEKDLLINQIISDLEQHCKFCLRLARNTAEVDTVLDRLLQYHKEIVIKLPRVTFFEQEQLMAHAKSHGIVDPQALLFLEADDFLSTDAETIHRIGAKAMYWCTKVRDGIVSRRAYLNRLRSLHVYSTPRQGAVSAFVSGRRGSGEWQQESPEVSTRGGKVNMVRVDWIQNALSTLAVTLCLILLLAPVIVLYLGKLSRNQSTGVVVAFALLFVVFISIVPGAKTDVTLVGASAYLAVLVTFIANLENNSMC
jgi:hypothetical protein